MRILVIGRKRSGTTITCKILNSHPDIWITKKKDNATWKTSDTFSKEAIEVLQKLKYI